MSDMFTISKVTISELWDNFTKDNAYYNVSAIAHMCLLI